MTGRMPSAIDCFDSGCDYSFSVPTLAHYLRAGGYETVQTGKAHFIGPDQLHGFEKRLTTDICPSDNCWYGIWDDPDRILDWFHTLKNVVTAGIAERSSQQDHDFDAAHTAVRWLYDYARSPEQRPFFLKVSFSHPHDPYVTPPAYWNRYRDNEIDMPVIPNIPISDRDRHGQWLYQHYDRGEYDVTDDHIRQARHGYYGSISLVDDLVGQVMDALVSARLDQNTIVVFTADHGDMLGERGMWFKMSFFEGSSRVPLMIAAPGDKGGSVSAPVSNLDITPTLADIAGVSIDDVAPWTDGESLMPLTRGEARTSPVLMEYAAEGSYAPLVSIREGKFKFNHCELDPPQLFDLESDPLELENLAENPEFADQVAGYMARVRERWDMNAYDAEVRQSQARRWIVYEALRNGSYYPWDFQPLQKASERYMRNHMDLNVLEENKRFPRGE